MSRLSAPGPHSTPRKARCLGPCPNPLPPSLRTQASGPLPPPHPCWPPSPSSPPRKPKLPSPPCFHPPAPTRLPEHPGVRTPSPHPFPGLQRTQVSGTDSDVWSHCRPRCSGLSPTTPPRWPSSTCTGKVGGTAGAGRGLVEGRGHIWGMGRGWWGCTRGAGRGYCGGRWGGKIQLEGAFRGHRRDLGEARSM